MVTFDRGSDCVAVLLHRAIDDKICLAGKESLEVIAGTRGKSESLPECAHREAAEEAGRLIRKLWLVTNCIMMPGKNSGKIAVYIAEDDGPADILPRGGLVQVRVRWIRLVEAWEMIESCEIHDAKTVIAVQALLLKQMK